MTGIEEICAQWQDVRSGLISEAELIPADQFDFRVTSDTRSVLELLDHIVESERALAGEMCREDTKLRRGIPAIVAEFAGHVGGITDKESVLHLLRSSFEETKAMVLKFGDQKFSQLMTVFDGSEQPKYLMLNFTMAHEMYHRGQLTMYERLMGIEPALTQFFKKMMAQTPNS